MAPFTVLLARLGPVNLQAAFLLPLHVPVEALFQLFVHDPNGIKIELNYAAQEAEGIEPGLMASDLIKALS